MIYPQTNSSTTLSQRHTQHGTGNRVYIENGEVKTKLVSDTIGLEEMRQLLHEMIDLEYSLP